MVQLVGGIDLSTSGVKEPGYKVVFSAPGERGESWLLSGAIGKGHDEQRVILLENGFSDGVSHPDMSRKGHPTGVGSRVVESFAVPEMNGGLSVLIAGKSGTAGSNFREWRRSWTSTLPLVPGGAPRPGRLLVDVRNGGNYWTPVVLSEAASSPKREPAHVHYIEDSVQWYSPAGCWYGPRRIYGAGLAEVIPAGDFTPHLELVWDGTPGTIQFPDLSTLTLGSATGGPFVVNLDRGMYGHTTLAATGQTASLVWSAFRGKVSGHALAPHVPHIFEIPAGCTLVVVPRFFAPWR